MRILEVVKAQVIDNLQTGNAKEYEPGDSYNGYTISRMKFITGEGLYLYAMGTGFVLVPTRHVGHIVVTGDASVPNANTLAASY